MLMRRHLTLGAIIPLVCLASCEDDVSSQKETGINEYDNVYPEKSDYYNRFIKIITYDK